jgi:hypothetical protein
MVYVQGRRDRHGYVHARRDRHGDVTCAACVGCRSAGPMDSPGYSERRAVRPINITDLGDHNTYRCSDRLPVRGASNQLFREASVPRSGAWTILRRQGVVEEASGSISGRAGYHHNRARGANECSTDRKR